MVDMDNKRPRLRARAKRIRGLRANSENGPALWRERNLEDARRLCGVLLASAVDGERKDARLKNETVPVDVDDNSHG